MNCDAQRQAPQPYFGRPVLRLADERVACTNALYILPRHWTGHIPVATQPQQHIRGAQMQ